MLDSIVNIVKSCAQEVISGNASIPDDKKDVAVEATAGALTKGIQENFNLSNLSNLTELFSGGSGGGSNIITNSIQSMVSGALASKVGLSSSVASGIAGTIVPMVMKAISKTSAGGSGIEGIIAAVSGGKGGGLLDRLKGLFS